MLASVLVAAAGPTPAEAQTRYNSVDRLYCAYFLRVPDEAGRQFWMEQAAGDWSMERIAHFFATSDEFVSTYGQQVTTGDFVRLIYRNLFNRVPDAPGFEFWTSQIDAGAFDRGSVMLYFSDSPEFRGRVEEVGCGNTGPRTTTPNPTPKPTINPAVANELASYADWTTPVHVDSDDRSGVLSSGTIVVDGRRIERQCEPVGIAPMSPVFREFPVNAFAGTALPGLIVEGAGVEDGDLRVVPLARQPFNLVASVDSTNNVQFVSNPQTSGIQTAVTALKRDADVRLSADGVDVVSNDITFNSQTAYSFEQTALNLGVSLRYKKLLSEASLDASFSHTRTEQRHSISVQLVQPMFTIRMERDQLEDAADYFDASVTASQVDSLVDAGRLGPDNPPLVIDSVTYGRILMFTMTSSAVSDASELSAIIEGTHKGIDGQATLTTEQLEILSKSEINVLSLGGGAEQARAAIVNNNLSSYFGPSNTTTAAPLTMTMRTLDDKLVDVQDEVTLKRIVCNDTDRPHEFQVIVSNIDNGSVTVTSEKGGQIGNVVNENTDAGGVNNLVEIIPANHLNAGWNKITFSFTATAGGCSNIFDHEEFNASIRMRPNAGSGAWQNRIGKITFDENECGTRSFDRWVNTTTGAVSASKP